MGIDQHAALCRESTDCQLEEVAEQAKRVREALSCERDAAAVKIEDYRRRVLAIEQQIRACPCCKKRLSLCEKHGLYVATDENVCPACWRGE